MYSPRDSVSSSGPEPGSRLTNAARTHQHATTGAAEGAAGSGLSGERANARPEVPAAVALPAKLPSGPAWAETYRRIMERAGPAVVIVNARGAIVYLAPAADPYLAFDAGEWTSDLSRAVHPALRDPMRTILARAGVSQKPETATGPTLLLDGERRTLRVRVCPLGDTLPGHLLVAIEAGPPDEPARPADDGETAQLRRQLGRLSAQHAAMVETHQASTTRLLHVNEKLRSASEELQTSREELQTLNEELTAANHHLGDKIDQLSQVNDDLRNLMAATAIATVFLDHQLCITLHTPAAAGLFRITERDTGRPLTDLRHHLGYEELEADAMRVLADLAPVEREVSGQEGRWFLVRLLPYRTTDDRTAGVVLTCVDITERKQAEAHRQAKEAAERINQARGEFLSRMSHELRTPLNAILGFGQVLELGSRDEQERTALGLILQAGRHLLSLVDEVLDLTQADGDGLRLSFGTVDPERLIRECLQLTARLAETRQVVCAAEETDAPALRLWTDEQRLRQVLLNLLTNAIKYNRPGGRVTLGCRRHGEARCLLSVHDTGCGIATEDLPRLFTPFERLHHQRGQVEGTGLGLAITRRLVEALGGTVGVESEPGRGSRFWVELPVGQAPATPTEETPLPLPAPAGIAAAHHATLLCVEDNASNLQLVQMVAARHWPRWRFLSARNAAAGLEQARRHAPDLILLDLQLPDRPGGEVLAELQRDSRTCRLPVVVLSADATAASREQLLAAGAAAFLTKPFQLDALVQAVNTHVAKPGL